MFKKTNGSYLAALLLGSCSFADVSQNPEEENNENTPPILYNHLSNIRTMSGVSPDFYDSIKSDRSASTKIGPLDIYTDLDRKAVGFKAPFLPAIEFPVENSKGYDIFGNREDYFRNVGQSSSDYWAVGNMQGNFNSIEYSNYDKEIPLSALGKVLKKILWGTELAAPLRKVANEISGLSERPTKFIFGVGAKSDLELKLHTDRIGLTYEVRFNPHFNMELEGQCMLNKEKDSALKLYFTGRF